MFNFNPNAPYPVVVVLILLGLAWLSQFFFSWLQIRRFYKRLREIRRSVPLTAVGVSGNTWTRKIYAVVAVDNKGIIRHAEHISGFSVFANLRQVQAVIGKPMDILWEEEPYAGVKPKLWDAMLNAAEYIDEHNAGLPEDASEEVEAEPAAAGTTS